LHEAGTERQINMEILLKKQEDGSYSGTIPEVAKTEPTPKIELDRNVLGGISSFKIMKVPIAGPIVAGAGARLVGGLADAFVAKTTDPKTSWANLGTKFAAAIAVAKFTPKWIGADIAEDTVKFIVYDMSKQMLPVERWVDDIVSKIRNTTGAPLRFGAHNPPAPRDNNIMREANKVAAQSFDTTSKSSSIFGGS